MKFASITSVDVERNFSTCKNILSDNIRSLVFEHIKQYIIVQCNTQNLVTIIGLLRILILHTFNIYFGMFIYV
jgi:hypothetical protein